MAGGLCSKIKVFNSFLGVLFFFFLALFMVFFAFSSVFFWVWGFHFLGANWSFHDYLFVSDFFCERG